MTGPVGCGDGERAVIVGIDGSRHAANALAWAAARTDALGPVTPVSVFDHGPLTAGLARLAPALRPSVLREAAMERLTEVVTAVAPDAVDRALVVEGHPGNALCRSASDAALLVVGSRGRGAVASRLLGSVSAHCVRHGPVPVAVVPDAVPLDRPLRRAVAGVDGSTNAEAALRWTLERVDEDGCVAAVGALSMWGYAAPEIDPTPLVMEEEIRRVVEETVAGLRADDRGWPSIDIVTAPRDARLFLREMADPDTDLLVVGSRGTTGLPHLLLGSVATAVAQQPVVPTVIVPEARR